MEIFGYIFAATAVCVWSVTFVNTRVLLDDFSSLEIMLVRLALAWAALLAAGFRSGGPAPKPSIRHEPLFAAMGLTGIAAYQFLENCAVYYTSAANVAIIISFAPVITAIFARLASRDRTFSPAFCAGSAIALCGVALACLESGSGFAFHPTGDLLAFAAMLCWGVYSTLLDKANKHGWSQTTVMRKSCFWAFILLVPPGLWGLTQSGAAALDGSFRVVLDSAANIERFSKSVNLWNFAFLGLMASAASFVLWNMACKTLTVARASILLYFTPFIGVLAAVVALDEEISLRAAAGGVLIVAGVAVCNAGGTRRENQTSGSIDRTSHSTDGASGS